MAAESPRDLSHSEREELRDLLAAERQATVAQIALTQDFDAIVESPP